MRRVYSFFLCLTAFFLMFGISGAQAEHTLRYPILIEPTHLNPFISDTIATSTIVHNIFEGMTQVDAATGDILPAIADSWIVRTLEDGRQVFTFTLRRGIMFHDVIPLSQREVTAEVIRWNYLLALNPNTAISVHSPRLRFIEGADAYQAAFEALGEDAPLILPDVDVAGIDVIDEYTIQFTLTAPDRLFLVDGMIPISSPDAYTFASTDRDYIPVGTGPYQFVEWIGGERILLTGNPDYYERDLPRTANVEFRIYESEAAVLDDYRAGAIDWVFNFPAGEREAIINEFSDEFFDREGLHLRYWGFNMATGFLSENLLVRQAMAHALDRDTAWTILAEGARFPANLGMLPPAMPASTPECIYEYNLERAAELLEQAGYPNAEGIPTIRIHLLEVIANEAQVELWIEALTSLGFVIEPVIEDSSTYWTSIVQDEAMVFQNGWAAGIVDPTAVFDFLILDGNGSMRYDNPEVNDLLRQARIELDPDVRAPLYQRVHDIVMCEAVVIPSAYSRLSWLQQPWIEHFMPGGGGTHTAPLWQVTTNR